MAEHREKLIIIGSGPAGYTAAIYAARAMLKPLLISGLQPGGQLTITTDVENYPGFADAIQGPWLVEQMRAQAEHVGTRFASDLIVTADLSQRPFKMTGDNGDVYFCDALVIATGAQAKWLGIPGEQKFQGFGVSACATCDGFFFRGKEVAVIGGGNSAVEEALYLAGIASKVTVIHRRDSFRAEKILQNRLFAHPKIEVVWNHTVDDIAGGGTPPSVTGVIVKSTETGVVKTIPVEGVFVAIGHSPASAVFADQLNMKQGGYIWTAADSTATSIEGVYAAGDVTDDVYRQAVTAAGMGCMAALEAERWLAAHKTHLKAAE
ncbi:MAG: thioredoxin-disulfide reductase [Alphaproteobacteria bacterium]|nr:thioredoxin-disulfide reductase [Alphaproteobacteria bacterium]